MKEIKNIKSVLYMYIYKICILSLKCLHAYYLHTILFANVIKEFFIFKSSYM